MSNKCSNRLRGDRRGLATLEFALVLPVLLLICFAILAYCMFFFTEESLRITTAYEARAYAIAAETGQTGQAPTFTTFLNPSLLTITTSVIRPANSSVIPPANGSGPTTVTVTGTYPFTLPIPFIPTEAGTLRETTSISFSQ